MRVLSKSPLMNLHRTKYHVCRRYLHRSVGIVGMPNVGKSSLFNALTKSEQAQAANYPFCTIKPNVANVPVPDARLDVLARLYESPKIIPSQIEFVDIAGLVRGASQGEGLGTFIVCYHQGSKGDLSPIYVGNQFLENIRQVTVLAHLVRCFDHPDIIHVEESVDPIRDFEIIQSELMLSDLSRAEKLVKSGHKNSRDENAALRRFIEQLENMSLEHSMSSRLSEDERKILKPFHFLSLKPRMILCNVPEEDAVSGNDYTSALTEYFGNQDKEKQQLFYLSAALEEALMGLDTEQEVLDYLECFDVTETGLTQVLRSCQDLLELQTYYTAGPKETRAWTIGNGWTAQQAAGVIHSDFERLFIRAETIHYDDFVPVKSEQVARERGLLRTEGKEYICQDGDIFHFLIGK